MNKLTATISGLLIAGLSLAISPSMASPQPADPLRKHQWGLDQIRIEPTREVTLGKGVVVAVIDSGVDFDHPDLKDRLLRGNTFLACGEKGCGDGDWTSGRKRDAVGHFHGTWVTGIIAAARANGIGIEGVAPEVQILPVRVLTGDGFVRSGLDIARAIRWSVKAGADVINLSLVSGVLAEPRRENYAAARWAAHRGVVVVGSAGNRNGFLIDCATPAKAPGTLCVGATSKYETLATYSNLGYESDRYTVFAPGGNGPSPLVPPLCGGGVLSTFPVGEADEAVTETCDYPSDNSYGETSGTSAAAPHVAGVAALLVSIGCDRAETIDIILTTARQPRTEERGAWTPATGFGIVDASAAIQEGRERCV